MSTEQHLKTFCATLSPWGTRDAATNASADSIDWVEIAAIANRTMLAPALYQACRQKDLLRLLPEQFSGYLAEIYRLNWERNQALLRQLNTVVALLNDLGVQPILLKGAATLVNDLFDAPGSRFMSDLDLLVPEGRMADAVAAFQQQGYQVPETYAHLPYTDLAFTDKHHYAPLVKTGEPAAVELHRRVLGRKAELLPSHQVWADSRAVTVGTGAAAVLPPEGEILCCFAHTQFSDAKHRDRLIDLRQMQHFAQLCFRHREKIDWRNIEQRLQACDVLPEFKAYLLLVKEYFEVTTPLTNPADSYARRHLRRVSAQTRRLPRLVNLGRTVWGDLRRAFTKENLIINYGHTDQSTARLRWRHLCFLINRYLHWQVWQEKFFKKRPF